MTIKATFDGKVFIPQSPVKLPVGFELEIPVPEPYGAGPKAPPLQELLNLVDQWPVNPDWPADGAQQHVKFYIGGYAVTTQ